MTTATARSGHGVAVHQTSPAAATTARLPMASLRLNSQTALTLASPARCGTSTSAAATLTASATAPNSPMSRSEEHTSELQSLMRISYAVFCLKKKKSIQRNYRKLSSKTHTIILRTKATTDATNHMNEHTD